MHRNLAYESAFLTKSGAIKPRDRVGALIAVGGSTRSWQSMALECMQAGITAAKRDHKVPWWKSPMSWADCSTSPMWTLTNRTCAISMI